MDKLCKICGVRPCRKENRKGRVYLKNDCSTCHSRAYDKSHPQNRKTIQRRHNDKYKIENANWKEQCMKHIGQYACHCGENHIATLSFHHRVPADKSFKLAYGYTHYYPIDRMKKEAEKCDIVCANCHLKLHATNPTGRNWTIKQRLLYAIQKQTCSKCGIDDLRVLIFHHPNDKLFTISKNWFTLNLDILTNEDTK